MSDANLYDIFISYARKDNRPIPESYSHGWVTSLRDQILADHRRFSTEPLRIFFDTDEIKDMDDWQHRILGALRHSKILLVCLSPSYFDSKPCRWEWEEYQKRQVHHLLGSEGVASIYFVEVPDRTGQEDSQWRELLQRSNFTDIRPWYRNGARAIQLAEVQTRLAKLGGSLWERISRTRKAETTSGNLRRQTPFFVGRKQELLDLHNHVGVGAAGVATVLHGLGGQGKTELTLAYAHAFADRYSAGLWTIKAEGKKELLPLIGELAFDPALGCTPPEAMKADPVLLGRYVLSHIKKRVDALQEKDPERGAAALLILDNVSEAELLAHGQLAALPQANWLRVVATTRLGPDRLRTNHKSLKLLEVGSLSETDALELIREHQPNQQFQSTTEETAARELARELGGFTLAVEQVAVFLGLHPEITCQDLLTSLRTKGLANFDSLPIKHADVASQILHQEKQLSSILQTTLAMLDSPALTTLRFAALLPPEMVPWQWLRELTLGRHPELGQHEPDEPDPWVEIRRRLSGLCLITPGDHPDVARIHRLVAAHVERTYIDNQELLAHQVYSFAEILARQFASTSKWERHDGIWQLRALAEFASRLLEQNQAQAVHFVQQIARGLVAHWLIADAERLSRRALEICEGDMDANRTIYPRILNTIGHVLREKKEFNDAKSLIQRALQLERNLAPIDSLALARCENNLAMTIQSLGDVTQAETHYQASLHALDQLTEPEIEVVVFRAVVWHNLADLWLATGRRKEAEDGFHRSLEYLERELGHLHLYTVQVRQNLAVLYQRTGRTDNAVSSHRQAVDAFQQILGSEHPRVGSARAWLASALINVGDYEKAEIEIQRAICILGKLDPTERYGLHSLQDLIEDYLMVMALLGRSRFKMQVALRLAGVNSTVGYTQYLFLRLRAFAKRIRSSLHNVGRGLMRMFGG